MKKILALVLLFVSPVVFAQSDDFNRANNTDISVNEPAGNTWAGTCGINTNAAYPAGSGDYICDNSGGTIADDQEASCTITAISTGYIGVSVRATDANNGYLFYGNSTDSYLVELDAASWTQIGTTQAAFSVNDDIRIEAEGTTIRAFINDTEVTSGTNSTHTTGDPGLAGNGNDTGSRCDDWVGQDLGGGGGGTTDVWQMHTIRRTVGPHKSQTLGGMLEK